MLRFRKEELATLLYHLSIMKKPFKKGIKKKHSKEEANEIVANYNSILDKLQQIDVEEDLHEIEFEHKEIELLQGFIPWYILELEEKLTDTEKEQLEEGLDILKTINNMLLIPV